MTDERKLTFIDVFAGCGGLSLGLMQANWTGLFAIEADRFAFETLKHNLLGAGPFWYEWPGWLPQVPREISGFLKEYKKELEPFAGKVDLLAGGPPCQGFSFAGRRDKDDPRNGLFKHYLEIVELLRPPLLFFENVRGVTIEFGKKHRPRKRGPGRPVTPFSVKIQHKLTNMGYSVFPMLVKAMDYGVKDSLRQILGQDGFRFNLVESYGQPAAEEDRLVVLESDRPGLQTFPAPDPSPSAPAHDVPCFSIGSNTHYRMPITFDFFLALRLRSAGCANSSLPASVRAAIDRVRHRHAGELCRAKAKFADGTVRILVDRSSVITLPDENSPPTVTQV